MKKRGDRSLKELYDLTQRISAPEITPVLEGSCRIQGPVEESDYELQGTNLGIFPLEKKPAFVNESLRIRAESGTCNVCSAPCSSCMHYNRTMSAMESKIECGFSGSTHGRKETDSCSFIGFDGVSPYKSRICDDSQHATSETSNVVSTSSSHDSYTENAESKVLPRASVTYASEDVDMPRMMPLGNTDGKDQSLPNKANVSARGLFSSNNNCTPDMCCRTSPSQSEEHHRLECHGDNISCITGIRDTNTADGDSNMHLDKKDAACSSASTTSLLSKGIENAVQVEVTDCYPGRGNEESQSNCRKLTTYPKDSLPKKSSDASSAAASFSDKYHLAEFPVPKVQSPHFHSQNLCSPNHNAEKDNSSSQRQVEPLDCSMDNGESSLGPSLDGGSIEEQKPSARQNNENNEASQIGRNCTSGTLKIDSGLETNNAMDRGASLDESVKLSTMNEQFEKPSSLTDTPNMQGSQVQPQPIRGSEIADSDTLLDDVKVCDICGDAGREDLLAICSRCSDGAEHTYCMRKKLDKVPEGEWLCEECKDKEDYENKNAGKSEDACGSLKECKLKKDAENAILDNSEMVSITFKECKDDTEKKVDKSELLSGTSKMISLNENGQNSKTTSNFKRPAKLDIKLIDPDTRGSFKELQSPRTSVKRHTENLKVISMTSKKASETNGRSRETASPKKKPVLSRENSFKNEDTGKVRLGNTTSLFGVQSGNSSQAFSRSQTLAVSNPSKIQAQLQSPHRLFSRSVSFGNLNTKPKVKQLTESTPLKQKLIRESTSSDTKREGLARSMSKSTSFKSISSGRSNIESASRTQTIRPSRAEDPRGLKQVKERNITEKKNSSLLDRSPRSPSPMAGVGISGPKVEIKDTQHDGKLNNVLQQNVCNINKGSENATDVGHSDTKKQSACLSKNSGSASFNGRCNFEDQGPCQALNEAACTKSSAVGKSCTNADTIPLRGVSPSAESTHRDDKRKDPAVSCSSRQAVSGGNRILHCQRCNESGHATQFCSIDKIRISALKPSAERNLNDGTRKISKWKDVVEATMSKARAKKHSKLLDETEAPMSSADLSCEVTLKDFILGPSSSSRNMLFVDVTTNGQEMSMTSDILSKTGLVDDLKHQAVQPVEVSCTSTESDLAAILPVPNELNVELGTQTVPDQTALVSSPLIIASAIPKLESIWQGGFEVLRTRKHPDLCDGVQAHLSTCASPKVLEVATKIPCKIQLEEVSCFSLWPLLFPGSSPKDDNVALFFFAQDVESYERSYSKLLENMLKNDLALRGNIDGVELLIFPSNKLPMNSQRWNRLFFLWGIFRESKTNSSSLIPFTQTKPCGSNLNMEALVQDFPLPFKSSVSTSQQIDSIGNPEELARCDGTNPAEALKSNTCVNDWPALSSSGIEAKMPQQEPPVLQHSLYQVASEKRQPLEQASYLLPVSCSLTSTSQLPKLLSTFPGPCFQSSTPRLSPKMNGDINFVRKLGGDADGRHVEPSSHVRVDGVPSCSLSSYYKQGVEGSASDKRLREKEFFIKSEPVSDDDPHGHSAEIDHLSWEPKPNRKRDHSCFTERVPQAYGHSSKRIGEVILWKEKENFSAAGDGREPKRMCYSDGHSIGSDRGEAACGRSSSKVHPLLASFSNEQQPHGDSTCEETMMAESSRRHAERFFFPVDPVPTGNTKSDDLIHILSSDDEDDTESNTPDLELALGGKKKASKPALPLLFPSTDRYSSQGPAADDDDDISASLSLSLAIPVSKEQKTKPALKTEQLLPGRPHVNTSLHLFGGFGDT